jgi:hypothetical protein
MGPLKLTANIHKFVMSSPILGAQQACKTGNVDLQEDVWAIKSLETQEPLLQVQRYPYVP